MTSSARFSVAAVLFTLALPLQAMAQAPAAGAAPAPGSPPPAAGAAQQKWMQVCMPELQKFCKAEAAAGTPTTCLKAHEKELSEECGDVFLKPYRVKEACQPDIDKFCKDAPQGGLGKCMMENKDKFAEKCKLAMQKGSKAHKAEVKAEVKAEAKAETAAEEPPKAEPKKRPAKKAKK